MSNLHVNLDEANKHTPKGFDLVGNNTFPTKDENGLSTYEERMSLPKAINFVDGTLAAPSTADGDVFVLTGSGVVHPDWGSATFDDWVRFTNSTAVKISPLAGYLCFDVTANEWKEYDGADWVVHDDTGATNLSLGPISSTAMDVNSSTGTNVTLTAADGTFAGVMPSAKFNEVEANTLKVTNATHTGEVSGSGLLTAQPTIISNKTTLGSLSGTEEFLINDGGVLKKVLASNVGGGGGIVGISDSSGIYTYYATLTLAMTAAVSGDTVTLFANIEETGAVEIGLKDGVNINLNGYTYTLNVATAQNSFAYNGAGSPPIECVIFNGTVKRIGGGISTAQYLCFYLQGQTNLTLKDVKVINDTGAALSSLHASNVINGGSFNSPFYTVGIYGGRALNLTSYSSSGVAYYASNSSSYNCIAHSDGSYGIELVNEANCYSCTGTSSVNTGFYSPTGTTGEVANCIGLSDTGVGMFLNSSGSQVGCVGVGKISYGILAGKDINNCKSYSETGDGGIVYANATNCSFESSGTGRGVYLAGGKLFNSFSKSLSSDAVFIDMSGGEVFNSVLEVVDNTKFCITTTSILYIIYYGQNTFKGATVAVSGFVTQAQTNNEDNQGNILIG